MTISLYTDDLVALDTRVARLKQLGWRRANRSSLIRIALARLTDDDLIAIATARIRGTAP